MRKIRDPIILYFELGQGPVVGKIAVVSVEMSLEITANG
jgi:hypothetical protein